tara:strand:+ start:5314 stop:5682 length:369 start_codon:yes stop_codon:yes gene_type:complete
MNDAFDRAWELIKGRKPDEIEMYEKGICPNCRGTGEITFTRPAHMTDTKPLSLDEIMDVLENGKTIYPYKERERKAQGYAISLGTCPSCNGSGKPNEEEWAIDGIHELNESWQGLPNWRGEP